MKRLLTIISLFMLCANCPAQKPSRAGHSIMTLFDLDDSSGTRQTALYDRGHHIWFKDSLIIDECLKSIGEDTGYDSWRSWTEVDRYLFMDLRKQSFYEYSSMSDTAKLLQVYHAPDDTAHYGFIPFHRSLMDSNWVKKARPIADTVIDHKVYSRYRFSEHYAQQEVEYTVYFDCHQRTTVLTWQKNFSEKKGCPVVRLDEKNLSHPGKTFIAEMEEVSTTLTPDQLRVFNAWEGYANSHPVTKAVVYEKPKVEGSIYQSTLKDRLFGSIYDTAAFISQTMVNGHIRLLKKYRKTAEMKYGAYLLEEVTAGGDKVNHEFILSKDPVSAAGLSNWPMEMGEVWLYQDGELLPAGRNKLVAHFNNGSYTMGTWCVKLVPPKEPGVYAPPACADWYWATRDGAGKIIKESFLFTSCDLDSGYRDGGSSTAKSN